VIKELITEKDWAIVRDFYDRRKTGEILFRRFKGRVSVRLSAGPSTKAWDCPWLVRMEVEAGNVYSTKYFSSVEELRDYVFSGGQKMSRMWG